MRHSQNYNFRLPERLPERNDPADIDDLTYDMESIDSVLKAQDTEDKRLERDKATVAALNSHKVAAVLDHPDRCVTDAKIGNRTVLTTSGLLQTLLTAIGNAIKAITGTGTWNAAPPVTLTAAKGHVDSRKNPHVVTKAQVGLGSVDDTADANKPVSAPQQTELDKKVDKVAGKGLSTEDYTTAEKADVTANTTARHSHGNKSVLDGITAALVTNWKAAYTHISDAVKHITAVERTLWNTVSGKLGLGGGTLTGFLTLHAAPTAPMHAANKKFVEDSLSAVGGGDMLKSVYDTNNDGVVDNAQKVNGLTVQTAVPAGAKFTDTVYSHPATHPAGIIAQDGSNRFVTDAEKAAWNGKAAGGHTHDERYFTEAEVNNLLAGRIPTSASCNKNWNWSGQGGQPSWLWGGSDGTNMYVYNPSNFNVNYANSTNWATSAGNADTVDGYHIAGIGTAAPGSLANNAFYFVYE